jgi:hypothetical protein
MAACTTVAGRHSGQGALTLRSQHPCSTVVLVLAASTIGATLSWHVGAPRLERVHRPALAPRFVFLVG